MGVRVHVAQFMVGHSLGGLVTLLHTTEHGTVRRYPDLYHEVFNEPERNEVLNRPGVLNADGRRCAALSGQADLGTSLFQLGLGGFGLVLRHALQQRLGRALDEVLGLLET